MFDRPSPKLLFDFFDAPDLKVAKDFALLFDFPDLVDLVPLPRPARLMSLKLSSTYGGDISLMALQICFTSEGFSAFRIAVS
jgi:hypothetical protein